MEADKFYFLKRIQQNHECQMPCATFCLSLDSGLKAEYPKAVTIPEHAGNFAIYMPPSTWQLLWTFRRFFLRDI